MKRLVVMLMSSTLVFSGCIQMAVTAEEKMQRACGLYVDASEEESLSRVLLHLREARHWAELARDQERTRWQASFDALGRLVNDADDPERGDRDLGASAAASRLVVSQCLDIVDEPNDRKHLETEPLIVIPQT